MLALVAIWLKVSSILYIYIYRQTERGSTIFQVFFFFFALEAHYSFFVGPPIIMLHPPTHAALFSLALVFSILPCVLSGQLYCLYFFGGFYNHLRHRHHVCPS